MSIDLRLYRIVVTQPYPLPFATISRRRLQGYGGPRRRAPLHFKTSQARHEMDSPSHDVRSAHRDPSPGSDYDLSGAHVLPVEKNVRGADSHGSLPSLGNGMNARKPDARQRKATRWAGRLMEAVRAVMAERPGADPDNVRHTLILLQQPPLERLRRSLTRGRALAQRK